MASNTLKFGQLVCSQAGRDKGRYFVVVEVVSDSMVKIVDGDFHRIEKPKKKNIKHLIIKDSMVKSITKKLNNGQRITNEQVRLALKETLREECPTEEV